MTNDLRSPGHLGPGLTNRRSLTSYLLVPRPTAVVVKGVILWAAVVFGAIFDEEALATPVADVVVLALAFELLVYQGRYMWNDLRGLTSDSSDLAASKPDRLASVGPLPERSLNLVRGVLVGRVIGWLVVVSILLDGRPRSALLAGGVVVWTVAGIYEFGRTRVTRKREPPESLIAADVLVYLVVGGGYAIRACLGLWLGTNGGIPIASLVVCGIAISAFGTMLVTMTWVIEGTQLLGPGSRSPMGFDGPPGKAHLGPLLRQAGMLDPTRTDKRWTSRDPVHWVPLAPSHGLRTCWNISFLVAAGVGGTLGMAMSAGFRLDGSIILAGFGAAAFAAIGAALLAIGPHSRRLQPRFLGVLSIGSTLLILLAWWADTARPWGAAIPYAVIVFVYWGLRSLDFFSFYTSATLLFPKRRERFVRFRSRFGLPRG